MKTHPSYFTWVLFAVTNLIGVLAGGAWPLLTLGVAFVIIPIADAALGRDSTTLSAEAAKDPLFKTNLYLYAGTQFFVFLLCLMAIALRKTTWWDVGALSLSFGIMSGALGITVAHELMHKPRRVDNLLAEALLLNVCYMHYAIEHLLGHHNRVATPHDPASARFGETFYEFLPRTLVGSYLHAWELERTRLEKRKKPLLSRYNKMIWYGGLPVSLGFLLLLLCGKKALVFFVLQSAIAIALLELVNYIEHYGLSRAVIAHGKYEKVGAKHSWNADHKFSNGLLFGLQRHPDHHLHPVRAYQALESDPQSPQLPYGYPTMALIALVPPLWRRIMDPRLEAFMAKR